ncbi:hypothetical protein RRF57_000201 [Xylaria bambusicola]|uniref:Uncharacterized protein n=1 Tax=Xylaria bambusicola TaxID=326684 RepID=A0AAN7YTY8_9PEZI
MAINSTIEADDSVHATVDAFQGTLYLADADPPLALAQIDFPQTTSSSMQAVNISQEIRISDQDAFTTFSKALLSSASVNVQVKGDTHIRVRGISRAYPATFDKTVALAGLNNFDGLSISDPSISIRIKGNFDATVHIPNPSVLTLEIVSCSLIIFLAAYAPIHIHINYMIFTIDETQGNTTFTSFLNNEDVGQTYINNLILRPGNNTFVTTADIQQLPILKALTLKPLCELNGKLPFQLKGKDVVNSGQVLPYFKDALAASSQNVTIDLSEAAKKIGIIAKCIGL